MNVTQKYYNAQMTKEVLRTKMENWIAMPVGDKSKSLIITPVTALNFRNHIYQTNTVPNTDRECGVLMLKRQCKTCCDTLRYHTAQIRLMHVNVFLIVRM